VEISPYEGKGQILVLRNAIPYKLSLIEPEDVHPVRKALLLQAQFINDPSFIALLGDFALFEKFALILTEGILLVASGGLGDPPRYTLSLPNGEVNLGEVWDIDTVVSRIWRDEEVQQRLAAI
jgi:hypothetical protein